MAKQGVGVILERQTLPRASMNRIMWRTMIADVLKGHEIKKFIINYSIVKNILMQYFKTSKHKYLLKANITYIAFAINI